FDVPGRAVRREVASLVAAVNEREGAALGPVCDVGETARPVYYLAVRPEGCNHLLRILVESEYVERHAIIKESVAAANRGLPVIERSPGEAYARRDAESIRDALPL